MASRNRGKICFWSNDATDMLIDLWSEVTIQFALESSKSSKETREVYSTLQVSNTYYLVQFDNSRLKSYVNRCHISAGTHKFKSAVLVSGVPFQKSTWKKHKHILPCKSSGPCPKLLARVPKFRSAMLKMIVV